MQAAFKQYLLNYKPIYFSRTGFLYEVRFLFFSLNLIIFENLTYLYLKVVIFYSIFAVSDAIASARGLGSFYLYSSLPSLTFLKLKR